MKQPIITKFGGTSVSSLQTWENIALITQQHIANGLQPIIVCSALTQISNQLEKAIDAAFQNQHQAIEAHVGHSYHELASALDVPTTLIQAELKLLNQWLTGITLLQEAPPKTRAQVLSLGELMMTRIGHAFLENKGIDCLWFDVRNALISTPIHGGNELDYLAAQCHSEPNPLLREQLSRSGASAIITQGFFAANPEGETVLLGRGGSDTSAALLAVMVEAAACEIWTDVPGIYTTNPHLIPHARLLKQLNYDEAQEIATMGAKVLHPRCLPPVRRANIPMAVKFTRMPHHSGTQISKEIDEQAPLIKSIQVKHDVMLISIDTLEMWQQVGFLANVFTAFKEHGFSIDLLSSSEFNITVSLDNSAKLRDQRALEDLLATLNTFGRAKQIKSCSAVSLVGHRIRTVLPQLGPTLELFDSQNIYLMSLASNDLNLSFVVETAQADKLCQKLHALLIENNPHYYSKSWHEEFVHSDQPKKTPWWVREQTTLLDYAEHAPCYVYHLPTQEKKADELLGLTSINQLFYAVKANPHPAILKTLYNKGIGFECVSMEELQHIMAVIPSIDKAKLIFTPNFAAKQEYEFALSLGCHLTIDSLYPLKYWSALFKNKSILLRIDPGMGAGHHKHVCTGGNESKFGIHQSDLPYLKKLIQQHQIQVIGLHAHSGSGILTPELWQQTAILLTSLLSEFKEIAIINLGGGLGIVEKPTQEPLNLEKLNHLLLEVKSKFPHLSFWLEPGRFFVAESGVLLAKVTQSKEKETVRFIGLNTGMNSLIRPALYNAYHEIVNLSQLNKAKVGLAHIVGPICESGDMLGLNRLFPETYENDIVLIANTGAYGHCMSSNYNLRAPAQELVFE